MIEKFVQEVLAQITWYHNLALLEKLRNLNCVCGMQEKHLRTAGADETAALCGRRA